MAEKTKNLSLNSEFGNCDNIVPDLNENFNLLDSYVGPRAEFIDLEADLSDTIDASTEKGDLVVTRDSGKVFRWDGSQYIDLGVLSSFVIYNISNDVLEYYQASSSSWKPLDVSPLRSASNLGSGIGVYAQIDSNGELQFKSLVGGSNITLTEDATSVTIAASNSSSTINNWWPDPLSENGSTLSNFTVGGSYTEKDSIDDDTFYNTEKMYIAGRGAGTGEDQLQGDGWVEFTVDVQPLTDDPFDPVKRIYFECDLELEQVNGGAIREPLEIYAVQLDSSGNTMIQGGQVVNIDTGRVDRALKIRQFYDLVDPSVSALRIRITHKQRIT